MYWRLPIGPGNVDFWHRHLGAGRIAGLVLLAILWVAIIVALVLAIRALILHSRRHPAVATSGPAAALYPPAPPTVTGPAPSGQTPASGDPTLAILEERYARGEINREEFLQRKQDLGL